MRDLDVPNPALSLRLLLVCFPGPPPKSADGPPLNPYTECKYPGECASAFWKKALLVKNDFCIPLAFIFELARNLPSALPRACSNDNSRGSLRMRATLANFLSPQIVSSYRAGGVKWLPLFILLRLVPETVLGLWQHKTNITCLLSQNSSRRVDSPIPGAKKWCCRRRIFRVYVTNVTWGCYVPTEICIKSTSRASNWMPLPQKIELASCRNRKMCEVCLSPFPNLSRSREKPQMDGPASSATPFLLPSSRGHVPSRWKSSRDLTTGDSLTPRKRLRSLSSLDFVFWFHRLSQCNC